MTMRKLLVRQSVPNCQNIVDWIYVLVLRIRAIGHRGYDVWTPFVASLGAFPPGLPRWPLASSEVILAAPQQSFCKLPSSDYDTIFSTADSVGSMATARG
jgi:hypothetical protein